ncbi:FISUMP domain-containing protein [Chryseobacterium fistulae]|uniref:Fibrobacter succinogenes major paralogous domain-containing protein n=1 Tax=Chryseobacterium fistulae TaxID=2675058 RepID=A0A6N4XRV8_9FLAO|nr:FISUMP domain-containing protein [Chryseobacterium fistulae]CAA7391357.1 hypothetical protein CHRY9393_02893 [Chryseobacterium fistulae]
MKQRFINMKKLVALALLVVSNLFYSQIRVVGNTPNPNQEMGSTSAFIDGSSQSDLNATTNVGKGIAFPRTDLSTFTSFAGSIVGIPTSFPYFFDGLIVYNIAASGVAGVGSTEGTLCRGFWYYDNPSTSSTTTGTWRPLRPDQCSVDPFVTTLDCATATFNPSTLAQGTAVTGGILTVPYTGGNGANYPAETVTVNGLTFTRNGGTLATGNGTLQYSFSGTPTTAGAMNVHVTLGDKSCDATITVTGGSPFVTTLDCSGAAFNPSTLTQGTAVSGGILTVPYTGGNGNSYPAEMVTVNGLTFARTAGTLATGNGTIQYSFSGTPAASGPMSVHVILGDKQCDAIISVSDRGLVLMCGTSKKWMRYNLDADTSLDADDIVSGGAGLHGNYYQWGRANAVATPSTPSGNIPGWNNSPSTPVGSWGAIKTSADPCPSGFRVPTQSEWDAITNPSNGATLTRIGNQFGTNPYDGSNVGSALQITCSNGSKLTLPAAGVRQGPQPGSTGGGLAYRGVEGHYWSSTNGPTNMVGTSAYSFSFTNSASNILPHWYTSYALPVRCIEE